MICRRLAIFLILFTSCIYCSAGLAASVPRMRPYTGIGLLVFSQSSSAVHQDPRLPLYEEPGLSRLGVMNSSRQPGNEWIFGLSKGASPLIVSARKGEWLRIYYDDAGREAWIDPQDKGDFQTWEQFLKLRTGHLLPALQPRYYQLRQQPDGKLLGTVTPKQVFKVLRLENAWSMVLTEQSQIGWLRWRDEDGRLLFGLSR